MIMDPSSRGMSKQIMLDWLRINHPQIPIKSGSTKTEVAKIVREVQPQYFPDPGGDAPAVDAVGTLSPGRLISSSSRILPPVDKSSVPLPPLITPPPPPPRLELMTKIGDRKKRFATNELDHGRLFKRSEPGNLITSPPEKTLMLLKKEKRHSKSGTSQRHMLNGVSQNQTFQEKVVSKSVPDAVGTQSSEKPKNHMRPLIDTSETLVSKPLPAAVGPQVSENHDNNISLLIDLSETNWMDTPNPVVGQDIPPIEIPLHSVSGQTSIKKSGVEVFQEERNRAQKVRELEESVENLRLRMEMNDKSDMTVLADEMRRDEEVRLLQVCVKDLKHKAEKVESLQATVATLQSEVTHLRKDLAAAVEDIQAHEDVIARLISMDDMDDLSSLSPDI